MSSSGRKALLGAFGRRSFIRGGAVAAGAGAISAARPFEALATNGGRRSPDYGSLAEVADGSTGLPLLKLPPGFKYVSFGWRGDPMQGGGITPGGHDGGAVIGLDDRFVIYIRNHELGGGPSFADPALTYDSGASGGTTNVWFDQKNGVYLDTIPSLSGTVRNCAGGITPWGTWLTCEENLANVAGTITKTHGWTFEVPAIGYGSPEPLTALGRFNHEAAAVDPHTGIVYQTEDANPSGIYRLLPKKKGDLRKGGKLQMLKVKGSPDLDTAVNLPVGKVVKVDWVDIADPTKRDHNPNDGLGVFMQGALQGGARIKRGEGMWYGNGVIYFISTSGGAKGEGQVFAYDPRKETLKVIFESPDEKVLDNPDNVAVSPRGGLVLCEDGDLRGQMMRGLTTDGVIFDFAQNNVVLNDERNGLAGDFRGSEWAGAAFTPNGKWLIASVQNPGITFAITGPWRSGAL